MAPKRRSLNSQTSTRHPNNLPTLRAIIAASPRRRRLASSASEKPFGDSSAVARLCVAAGGNEFPTAAPRGISPGARAPARRLFRFPEERRPAAGPARRLISAEAATFVRARPPPRGFMDRRVGGGEHAPRDSGPRKSAQIDASLLDWLGVCGLHR